MDRGEYDMKMDLIEGEKAKKEFAKYIRDLGNAILDGKYKIEVVDLEETFDEPQEFYVKGVPHEGNRSIDFPLYTKRDRTINIHLRIKENK